MKQKIEKWKREIERIQQSVIRLADYRRWNRVYERVVNAHPKLRPGIPILDYFRNVYGDYAAMAIRRQGRPHKDSVSLLGFLEDLAANASFITRDWMRELYREPVATIGGMVPPGGLGDSLADKDFQKFADSSGLVLDAQKVLDDIAKLKIATERIVAVTDTTIAHDDKNGPEFQITFDDLNVAIDVLEEITRKYVLLFTATSMLSMTPIDTTNAIAVFNFPWIDPNNRPDLSGLL